MKEGAQISGGGNHSRQHFRSPDYLVNVNENLALRLSNPAPGGAIGLHWADIFGTPYHWWSAQIGLKD